jgi:hypothetical protein
MSLLTTWGYTITDAETLPALLTPEEFNTFTANKYAGDARIEANIKAASEAVRAYCGWHLFPVQACSFSERLLSGNGRLKRSGPDILIQLPAVFIPSVSSVEIGGNAWADYAVESNGLLRLFDVPPHMVTRKTEVSVTYSAGLPSIFRDAIKELLAHRVTHALASSAGVQTETAGGVSVTYSANWINSARSTALAEDNKEVLSPYKLREVF